jgi:hypothetical protein
MVGRKCLAGGVRARCYRSRRRGEAAREGEKGECGCEVSQMGGSCSLVGEGSDRRSSGRSGDTSGSRARPCVLSFAWKLRRQRAGGAPKVWRMTSSPAGFSLGRRARRPSHYCKLSCCCKNKADLDRYGYAITLAFQPLSCCSAVRPFLPCALMLAGRPSLYITRHTTKSRQETYFASKPFISPSSGFCICTHLPPADDDEEGG